MVWIAPHRTFCKVMLQTISQGRHPLEFAHCSVSIETLTEIGKYWIHDNNYPLNAESEKIQLGTGQTPFCLVVDECLLTLKEKEVCEIFVNADGSIFDESGLPAIFCQSANELPLKGTSLNPKRPKSEVSMLSAPQVCKVKITLNSILEPGLDIFDISPKEKLHRAHVYKEKGNNLFKNGHKQLAFEQFGRSLRYLICMGPDIESESFQEYTVLKTQCYLNLAACQNQTNNHLAVIQNCTKALILDPQNVKALFRRGQAHTKGQDYVHAKEDLSKANALDPENKAVEKLLVNIKERIRAEEQKLACAMSKMFH